MTDLRTLLHDAAPRPSRRIDVDALIAEAARRRPWRRIVLWFASIAAVVGIGGGAIVGLAPADRPAEVGTVPAPSAISTTTTTPSDSTCQVVAAGDTPVASPGSASAMATPDADEPAWYQHEPPHEECDLHPGGYGLSQDGVGGAGFDDPRTQTCTFTATAAGGYRAAGTWSLTIERDGQRIDRSHVLRSATCEDVGFIRRGDVVTVQVRTPGGATTVDTFISAGPRWSCSG